MEKDYSSFINLSLEDSSGFRLIVERLSEINHGKAIIFAHDDPDGLTSGALCYEILSRLGIKADIFFPPSFMLSDKDIDDAGGLDEADMIFIIDKGTFKEYSRFKGQVKDVFVIDHHPPQGIPDEINLFNPNLEKYTQSSASMLMHMIFTEIGFKSDWADFINLIGLKGDFAIEPVTGIVAEHCSSFYKEVQNKFTHLFQPIEENPTLFDVSQRKHTCLLSQITELIHVVCGGGFQFFYKDRDADLKGINEPRMVFDNLLSLRDSSKSVTTLTNKQDFLAAITDAPLFTKIFNYFKEDWDKIYYYTEQAIKVANLEDTDIYFFSGHELFLLPMICSVKIYEIKEKTGAGEVVGLFFNTSEKSLHLTGRGTGEKVHCGAICRHLADRINKRVTTGTASGGGHPKASECFLRDSKSYASEFLNEFFTLINELLLFSQKKNLSKADVDIALDLGLTFMKGN